MIKVYKLKAVNGINDYRLRVSQTYRFTEGMEYIGRCKDFNTILVYDDIGNGIEFDMPIPGRLKLNESILNVFTIIDSFDVKNKKELKSEILKVMK